MTAGTVRAPGGPLRGRLTVAASGPRDTFTETCNGHRRHVTSQPVVVSGGSVQARFDSIGTVEFGAPTLNADDLTLQR